MRTRILVNDKIQAYIVHMYYIQKYKPTCSAGAGKFQKYDDRIFPVDVSSTEILYINISDSAVSFFNYLTVNLSYVIRYFS